MDAYDNNNQQQQLSALDVVQQQYEEQAHNRCSRLLLCGSLTPPSASAASNHSAPGRHSQQSAHTIIHQYTQLLDTLKQHHASITLTIDDPNNTDPSLEPLQRQAYQQQITGLLLIFNDSALVLLLESSTPIIMDLLRAHSKSHQTAADDDSDDKATPVDWSHWKEWQSDEDGNSVQSAATSLAAQLEPSQRLFSSIYQQMKVLAFSENVPREYNCYTSRQVRLASDESAKATEATADAEAADADSNTSPQDLINVFDTLRQLLEIGRDTSAMSMDKAIDYIQTTNSRLLLGRLPTAERLHHYLQLTDFFQPSDMVDMYDAPFDVPADEGDAAGDSGGWSQYQEQEIPMY